MKRHHIRLSCPHCGSYLTIRSSNGITPVYREAYVHCTNVDACGWRGKMGLELTSTLCPSSQPNPEVNLPLSPSLLAQLSPETN
ncbi:Ogr/Delta-like zinc finger [Onishia taeanensis]|uniref:Ogr/Delta-like zinc finger n=1 Tax=Onishia taeanensis TaxID=284577 RepID=A0A1G7SWK7_9GAMM|nr:ogr/Delta-like zinc finger family protein [Halomonas taeanensis]SDG27467.1 Ogr/Delta-like zinc finger [Halomonas taeanensis]